MSLMSRFVAQVQETRATIFQFVAETFGVGCRCFAVGEYFVTAAHCVDSSDQSCECYSGACDDRYAPDIAICEQSVGREVEVNGRHLSTDSPPPYLWAKLGPNGGEWVEVRPLASHDKTDCADRVDYLGRQYRRSDVKVCDSNSGGPVMAGDLIYGVVEGPCSNYGEGPYILRFSHFSHGPVKAWLCQKSGADLPADGCP